MNSLRSSKSKETHQQCNANKFEALSLLSMVKECSHIKHRFKMTKVIEDDRDENGNIKLNQSLYTMKESNQIFELQ